MTLRFLAFSVALVACSSSTPVLESPGGADAGSSDAPPGFQHEIVVSMDLTVQAGQEKHTCQLVALPNDAEANVVSISHEYTVGSHHFVLFTTDLETIPPDLEGQYDCVYGDEPIMAHSRAVLYAAQTPHGESPFPQGVGYPLKAHQVLVLQAHYINTTSQDIHATVRAGFDTAPIETTPQRAGFLVFYDPFIYVPPQASATTGIRCSVPRDITIFAASTHYHQRGTGMKIWMDPAAPPPSESPFFETHDWEHAPNFTGPLTVPAGSFIRTQCEYQNADVAEVFQGPNAATSEMCLFAGLYYPRIDFDFETCLNISVTGTGTQPCADELNCIKACPPADAPVNTHGGVNVGPCWEKCVAAGCAGATDAMLPLTICIGNNCAAECAAGDCSVCVVSKCGAQLDACFGHTCSP
jgi:hypothetical protein